MNQNKDDLLEQEDEIDIGVDTMIVKGRLNESASSRSTASSAQSDASQVPGQQAAGDSQAQPGAMPSGAPMASNPTSNKFLTELKNEEALASIHQSQELRFSSQPQSLTENDAEYIVTAVKHFFESVIVVQYEIKNTLEDQILSNV